MRGSFDEPKPAKRVLKKDLYIEKGEKGTSGVPEEFKDLKVMKCIDVIIFENREKLNDSARNFVEIGKRKYFELSNHFNHLSEHHPRRKEVVPNKVVLNLQKFQFPGYCFDPEIYVTQNYKRLGAENFEKIETLIISAQESIFEMRVIRSKIENEGDMEISLTHQELFGLYRKLYNTLDIFNDLKPGRHNGIKGAAVHI